MEITIKVDKATATLLKAKEDGKATHAPVAVKQSLSPEIDDLNAMFAGVMLDASETVINDDKKKEGLKSLLNILKEQGWHKKSGNTTEDKLDRIGQGLSDLSQLLGHLCTGAPQGSAVGPLANRMQGYLDNPLMQLQRPVMPQVGPPPAKIPSPFGTPGWKSGSTRSVATTAVEPEIEMFGTPSPDFQPPKRRRSGGEDLDDGTMMAMAERALLDASQKTVQDQAARLMELERRMFEQDNQLNHVRNLNVAGQAELTRLNGALTEASSEMNRLQFENMSAAKAAMAAHVAPKAAPKLPAEGLGIFGAPFPPLMGSVAGGAVAAKAAAKVPPIVAKAAAKAQPTRAELMVSEAQLARRDMDSLLMENNGADLKTLMRCVEVTNKRFLPMMPVSQRRTVRKNQSHFSHLDQTWRGRWLGPCRYLPQEWSDESTDDMIKKATPDAIHSFLDGILAVVPVAMMSTTSPVRTMRLTGATWSWRSTGSAAWAMAVKIVVASCLARGGDPAPWIPVTTPLLVAGDINTVAQLDGIEMSDGAESPSI